MNDLNVIDRFMQAFITYIDAGFGLLGGDVHFLTVTLIGIDVTLAGLFWAMGGDDNVIGRFLTKILYIGAFAFILNSFSTLADIIFRSFAQAGLTAGGGSMSAGDLLKPGRLAGTGFSAAWPLLQQVSELTGFVSFFDNFLTIAVLLFSWAIVIITFFILAVQMFVTIIEFKLTSLAGFILVPFALWNRTSFLAERVLGNVVSSGIKVMVLAVIVGIGSNFFNEFTTALQGQELIDRFEASRGRRMLAFVDACAWGFAETVLGRDVVSDLDSEELRESLSVERYSGIFLSCEPGQVSYPPDAHRHGIWTYFLLTALGGEAEKALDRDRYLTDRSLRDYLTAEVPAFLRSKTQFRGQQRPRAIIDASRTFAIWQVPELTLLPDGSGDFIDIRFAPEREFFEHIQTGRIASLNGFSKKFRHFVPERVNDAATGFIRDLMEDEIAGEIQALYEHAKDVFRLKRKATSLEIDVGQASLDTDVFRFSIEAAQDVSEASGYVVIRRLDLREGAASRLEEIDTVFGDMFNRIVVQQRGDPLDFDDLVDQLEDIAETRGGAVRDELARDRVSYFMPDGTNLVFDIGRNLVRLERGGKQDCGQLLEHARQYRFGLTARSTLLAGPVSTLALSAPSNGTPQLPPPKPGAGKR